MEAWISASWTVVGCEWRKTRPSTRSVRGSWTVGGEGSVAAVVVVVFSEVVIIFGGIFIFLSFFVGYLSVVWEVLYALAEGNCLFVVD